MRLKLKIHRFLIPMALVSLSLLLAGFVFLQGFQPVGGTKQTLIIPEGTGKRDIAKLLKERKIIRSDFNFLVLMLLGNKQIKAGTYELNPNDNLSKIATMLSMGKETLIRITIPEGWRKEQIAELLTQKGLDGQGFLALTADKEGYLFPDTYFLTRDATAQQILAKFDEDFAIRTKDLNPSKEQLILASIIEREAKGDADRELIAGIYTNRLKRGMPLEADPTVQYGKESNALIAGQTVKNFWQPIKLSDYKGVSSPYNTYLIAAYPPGPICNPGLKSIAAAVKPIPTEAIYFFHTRNGTIMTSKTLDEHRQKVQKFM